MKKLFFLVLFGINIAACTYADDKHVQNSKMTQTMKTIQLNAPNLKRGTPVMQAFSQRKSTKECSPKELSLQDLSDLLWASNGINRPQSGKRTAPSAMNRQDVKVYVCMKDGSYLYDPKAQTLQGVSIGDARPATAPVVLVLVADTPDRWAAMDAGIVSQNISIFCAGTGLATYPRATMDESSLKKALNLSGSQTLLLCHPTGYFVE